MTDAAFDQHIDTLADWHTHSDLTDGADTPQAMADAAATAGLTRWALSDHVRASSTWVPDYVTQVRALRVDGVQVLCGVEAKVLDVTGRLDLPPDLPELDHVLVADHQFPGVDGPEYPDRVRTALADGSRDPAEVLAQLVTATARAVAAAPYPPIVAHLFSLLPKTGLTDAEVGDDLIDLLADACLAAGARVEVNEKWRCPSLRVLHRLAARGVELTAGSDAHRVADVGRWSYVDEYLASRAAAV